MTASEIAKHVQIVLDLREKEDSLLWHGAAAAVLRLVGDLEGDELEARVEELLGKSETELQAGPHVTLEGRRIFVDYSNDDGNCAWTTFEDLCVQALRLDGDLADWQDGLDALSEKDREAAEKLGDALLYPQDWLPRPAAADSATVIFNGHKISMAAARALMDDELCEEIHGTVDTEQEFLDAYLAAHAAKYGEDFCFG